MQEDISGLSLYEAAIRLGASVRLVNALRELGKPNGRVPNFGQYLRMGDAGPQMLLRLPRLGRTSVQLFSELCRTVSLEPSLRSSSHEVDAPDMDLPSDDSRFRIDEATEALDGSESLKPPQSPPSHVTSVPDLDSLGDLNRIRIDDAVEALGGSEGLLAALRHIEQQKIIVLPSVQHFVDMGPAADEMFMSLGLKHGQARELYTLMKREVNEDQRLDGIQSEPKIVAISPEEVVPPDLACSNKALVDDEPVSLVAVVQEISPEEAFRQLPEQDQEVLRRRFGLDGHAADVLADIGLNMGVTRERVRQIEDRSLRRLHARYGEHFQRHLEAKAPEIWTRLSAPSSGAAIASHRISEKGLSGWERLVFAVAKQTLNHYLEKFGWQSRGGLISNAISSTEYAAALDGLSELGPKRLPIALDQLEGRIGASEFALAAAVETSREVRCFLNYVIKALTKRTRRVVRIHRLMRERILNKIASLKTIHAAYRESYADDHCSPRDITIVMTENRQLFLNLYESGWLALGSGLAHEYVVQEQMGPEVQQEIEPNTSGGDEATTVAGVLRRILKDVGACTFDDLRQRFMRMTNNKYSQSSVGPILLLHADFVRFAPGVYGLEEQLSDPRAIDAAQKILLNEQHLRFYCLARWAEEPMGSYPLWTAAMERNWAEWALANQFREPLNALMYVSQIEEWPVSLAEQAKWLRMKELRASFFLMQRNEFRLTKTIPTYADILRTAVVARASGGLSWISANRSRGVRADDRHAHSVLAFLIWLGVLLPADHWQAWHRFDNSAEGLVEDLIDAHVWSDGADWPESLRMRESGMGLRRSGWVDEVELKHLLGAIWTQVPIDPERPVEAEKIDLQSLMDDVALQQSLRERDLG